MRTDEQSDGRDAEIDRMLAELSRYRARGAKLEAFVPAVTRNLTNGHGRGHWAVLAKRAKAERTRARLKAPRWAQPLLRVLLTRVSPRELDDDGLRAALKHVRDGVADALRVDDRTPLVRWEYTWEKCSKGQEGVRVRLEAVTD